MLDPTPRRASAYLGDNGSGASRPQKFLVDDVGQALVKFFQSPQGKRLVVNEFIGYSLAEVLRVDCPQGGVVDIDAKLLPDNGKLYLPETDDLDACTYEAGLHFYSQYFEPVDRIEPDDLRGLSTQNTAMFAGVLLLDLLLNNRDRGSANMNLILHRAEGAQRLVAIDFGHAFGGGELWTIGNLKDVSLPLLSEPLPYAEGLEAYLRAVNPSNFAPFLERLSSLSRENLNAIITAIPNEWQVTVAECKALLNYLSHRAQALPEYLRERLERDVWWQ